MKPKKRGKGQILENLFAEHVKFCQKAWKQEDQGQYFQSFLAEHIFNFLG